MAKKSMLEREKKREKMVARYAKLRAELRAKGDYEALSQLPANASPVRLHNRCKVTGRPHGYMRKFGISRITFRELAYKGQIPGVKKPAGNVFHGGRFLDYGNIRSDCGYAHKNP